MKRSLLPALAVSSLMLFTVGCGERTVVTDTTPPPDRLKPKPKVYRADDLKAEEAAREAAMAREIEELEAEAGKLRQEIALEQLALDRAALEEEQRRLDQDRIKWLNEQAAAVGRVQPVMPLVAPVASPPVRDYSYFYTELESQGSWFQSVDYGYVWQPTVALQTSWRPYTVGRWAACDRGWTWLSDEPFGWATYHYGRWTKVKSCGWIWVPGEVWAPAWVAWRRSEKYVGWCPLPPETLYRDEVTYDSSIDKLCGIQPSHYIFITVKQFCLPVHRHVEPADRSALVCRDTTNITRLCVSRDRVDCSGPKYEWIKDRLPRAPGRYTLANDPHGKGFRIDRDRLCVFAPLMRAPWNPGLHPRDVTGPLPGGEVITEGTVLPDKIKSRFREDKKGWLAAGTTALKGESARGLTERQERVVALTAAVEKPLPARPERPIGGGNSTLSPAGVNPVVPSVSDRRAQREQIKKEVAARHAELDLIRGTPHKNTESPARVAVAAGTASRPVIQAGDLRPTGGAGPTLNQSAAAFPAAGAGRPQGESAEVQRVVENPPVTHVLPGGSPTAVSPEQESSIPAAVPTITEVTGASPDIDPVVTPVRRLTQADLESRRTEVARLKQTQAAIVGSGKREATPNVQMREPLPPMSIAGSIPEASPARRDPAASLVERREKAALLSEELAARQQAMQQQREAQAQAQHEQELAQSAADAARQQEAKLRAESARAAEQQQVAANRMARQQDLAKQAVEQEQQQIHQQQLQRQQQAELAAQAAAARDQQQQETEAARERMAAERAQMAQQAAQQEAQRQARQEEMNRQQQEAAARAQQEQAVREQAQRQAEERARQEEMIRQQQEAAARAQQEQAAREQAQRQAEERARQEEMIRQQQEAAARAQQEQAAREQAQRQAEERARQEEMARQQREAAQREAAAREQAAREQAQRQAEEAARAAEEAAKNGNK